MATIHASAQHGGILLLTFDGNLGSLDDARQFVADVGTVAESIRNLHKSQGKRIKILIDISAFEAGPNTQAFEALVKLAQEDTDFVEKTAIFGGTSHLQMLGQAAAYLAGRSNIHFFLDREKAHEWLGL